MMANELPARYARLSAAQAAAQREMTLDVLAEAPDNQVMREHLANLEAVLRLRGGESTATPVDSDHTEIGRRAGSTATNQFGTFAVHAASDAQIRFLRSLIAEKDTAGVKIPATLDGISKKSATALIDKLVDRPAKPGVAGAHTARPASEKQVAFLRSLMDGRDWAGVLNVGRVEVPFDTATTDPATLTSAQASAAIETLKAAPRRQQVVAPAADAEIAAGAYKVGDRVIRVYLGQQSRKMLAGELVDATAETCEEAWRYLGLASRFVPADARRMTVEECEAIAGASQADHGWCCVCGRRLDDLNSVQRGIGPVCRRKQGGA